MSRDGEKAKHFPILTVLTRVVAVIWIPILCGIIGPRDERGVTPEEENLLQIGMTKQEVLDILGPPLGSCGPGLPPVSQSSNCWEYSRDYGDPFQVDFDRDGRLKDYR